MAEGSLISTTKNPINSFHVNPEAHASLQLLKRLSSDEDEEHGDEEGAREGNEDEAEEEEQENEVEEEEQEEEEVMEEIDPGEIRSVGSCQA